MSFQESSQKAKGDINKKVLCPYGIVRRRILINHSEEVGVRYEVFVDAGSGGNRVRYMSADTSNKETIAKIDRQYASIIAQQPALHARVKDDMVVTYDETNVVEIDSIRGFKQIISNAEEYIGGFKRLKEDIEYIAESILHRLRREGFYYEDVRTEGCTIEVRFLGGFEAWSGADEDICDADVLNRTVGTKVVAILKEYSKAHNLDISFSTGEKAWSYIDLAPGR